MIILHSLDEKTNAHKRGTFKRQTQWRYVVGSTW